MSEFGRIDLKVRQWLRTEPGPFRDENYLGVIERARQASGIECGLGEFADSLARVGWRPQQRGSEGMYFWLLGLPMH